MKCNKLLLQMNHQAGQSVSVGLRQLTNSLVKHGQTVAVILNFYKNIKTSQLICLCMAVPSIQKICSNPLQVILQVSETHQLLQ